MTKKRGTWIADQFRAVGALVTINSQSVRVLHRDPAGDVLMATGAFAVTDGGAGYAKGCIFIRTNGSTATTLYINEGSNSSSDFNAMETSASTITSVIAGLGLTGGATEGAATVNVGAGRGTTVRADAVDLGVDVYNDTGGTLVAGTLVRLAGFNTTLGTTVAKADADAANAATHIVVEAITNNTAGVVYPMATVTGLATNGTTIGDAVYLDATTAGAFVFTPPTGADQLGQVVGFVKVVHASTGEIVFFPGFSPKKFGTSFLQDSAVTAGKIASDAVTVGKIFAGSVTRSKMSTAAASKSIQSGGGTIATTGSAITTCLVPEAGTLTSVDFSGNDALAANDTNYITWTIQNLGQDGNGTAQMLAATDANTTKATGGTALGAAARRQMTLTDTGADLVVAAGDRLKITATVTGTLSGSVSGPAYLLRFGGTT